MGDSGAGYGLGVNLPSPVNWITAFETAALTKSTHFVKNYGFDAQFTLFSANFQNRPGLICMRHAEHLQAACAGCFGTLDVVDALANCPIFTGDFYETEFFAACRRRLVGHGSDGACVGAGHQDQVHAGRSAAALHAWKTLDS
jgi:hypothetical protein